MRVSSIIERVSPEPEHGPDAIDEIVATGVNVHLERMSDGAYWLSIERDGQRQTVTLATRRGALIVARTEVD